MTNATVSSAYVYSMHYSQVHEVPVICINVWPKLFGFVLSNAWYSPTVEHSAYFNLHCMTNGLQAAGPMGSAQQSD